MAAICNRIAALDPMQLKEKTAAATSATASVLSAFSDCYAAAEMLHLHQPAAVGAVYLNSADGKLDTALSSFVRNREILYSVEPSREALDWLQSLDYDRLYRDGNSIGDFPANAAQWSRLACINQERGYLGVIDALIDDVRTLQCAVRKVVDGLGEGVVLPEGEVPASLTNLLGLLSDFAAFAQMVASFNRLTPLDGAYLKESASAVAAS